MEAEVRAILNEFRNLHYYEKKLAKIDEQIKLVEWDLYHDISSPMKTERYTTIENGKFVERSTFSPRIHNPNGKKQRFENLEKERDRLNNEKMRLKAQIKAIERYLDLLEVNTRQIVKVAYIENMGLEKASRKLKKDGIYYTPQGLYLKVIREIKRKKDLF